MEGGQTSILAVGDKGLIIDLNYQNKVKSE